MVAFEVDGKRFELTLIEKRAPKKWENRGFSPVFY
jgi:hypothetical protein